MALPTDITGKRFGRLVALRYSHHQGSRRIWLCKCDCGKTKPVHIGHLNSGHIKSCGCFRREWSGDMHRIHGLTKSREYKTWVHMRARCFNKTDRAYPHYGGRGITVCKKWRDSFMAFRNDMGPRPPGLTLDRKNNDGNYEPKNCRWATRTEQARNKRSNRFVILQEVKTPLTQIAESSGMRLDTLYQRLDRDKFPVDKLADPPRQPIVKLTIQGETKTIKEWSTVSGLPAKVIYKRWFRNWPENRLLVKKCVDHSNLK